MARLRMAVVGVGHLGKEHARILAGMPEVDLVGVADTNLDQAQGVAKRHGTQAFSAAWPLLNLVDAAAIVVPTCHHEAVAGEFLRRGIPVLVEKPLAHSLQAAEKLVELSRTTRALIQVGHIERFNPAFEEVQRRRLHPKYVRAERLVPFSGRSFDTGVVLDLMIHEFDMLLALVGSSVAAVEGLGVSLFGKHEDIANARLYFANGCIADLTASRAHPTAHRQMHLWSAEGYAGIDFAQRRLTLIQPSAPLRARGLDPAQLDPVSRARIKEELFTRHLEVHTVNGQHQDQLTAELKHFVACVQTGARPRVNGEDGRNAVALAERILASINRHAWTGTAGGPVGPLQVPAPLGRLFVPSAVQEVG